MSALPKCEMRDDCTAPITHIGEKGYVYCAEHAPYRRGWERTRTLRPWELQLLRDGKPVPSYRPISRAEAAERGLLPSRRRMVV